MNNRHPTQPYGPNNYPAPSGGSREPYHNQQNGRSKHHQDYRDNSYRYQPGNTPSNGEQNQTAHTVQRPSQVLRRMTSYETLHPNARMVDSNGNAVLMVSEGGKLVPRVMPSVKRIEKTIPKRLPDQPMQAAQLMDNAENDGQERQNYQRRGRIGGVGFGSGTAGRRESGHGKSDQIIEPKRVPPMARSVSQYKNNNSYYHTHEHAQPTSNAQDSNNVTQGDPTNEYNHGEHVQQPRDRQAIVGGSGGGRGGVGYQRSGAGSSQDNVSGSVPRAVNCAPVNPNNSAVNQLGNQSDAVNVNKSVAGHKDHHHNFVRKRPDQFKDRKLSEDLNAQILQLRAEIRDIEREKKLSSDSLEAEGPSAVARSRLQPISSSQPLSAQGLVSPTYVGRSSLAQQLQQKRPSVTSQAAAVEKTVDDDNKASVNDNQETTNKLYPDLGKELYRNETGNENVSSSVNANNSTDGFDNRSPRKTNDNNNQFTDSNQNVNPNYKFSEDGTGATPPQAAPVFNEPRLSIVQKKQQRNFRPLFTAPNVYHAKMKFEPLLKDKKKTSVTSISGNEVTDQVHPTGGVRRSKFKDKILASPLVKFDSKKTKAFVRRETERKGCCGDCCTKLRQAKSSSILLLPFHVFYLVVLFLYIVLGALLLVKSSEGRVGAWHWEAVTGRKYDDSLVGIETEVTNRVQVREVVSKMVLDASMEAVLVRSKDAVINAIKLSPEMQGAFRAFQQVGLKTLPDDETLKGISDDIMRRWMEDINAILVRNDYISDLYTMGYQITPSTTATLLSLDKSLPEGGGVSWSYRSALLHSFCLVTTIGGGSSVGGSIRVFVVAFTAVGAALYCAVVLVWGARISATYDWLLRCSATRLTDHRRGPALSSKDEAAVLPSLTIVWVSLTIVLLFILGMGSTVGSPASSYGDRLEAACLALLLVRPPYPLPESEVDIALFIVFVFVGHVLVTAFLKIVKEWIVKNIKRCFVQV